MNFFLVVLVLIAVMAGSYFTTLALNADLAGAILIGIAWGGLGAIANISILARH